MKLKELKGILNESFIVIRVNIDNKDLIFTDKPNLGCMSIKNMYNRFGDKNVKSMYKDITYEEDPIVIEIE